MSATATVSNLQASTMTREKEDIYKQIQAIFNDFSEILVAVIGAKSFFATNQNVMICLMIMIVVYFLVFVLGTLLQLYIRDLIFFAILSCIMLLLACAATVLALILIEPTIAFLVAILWVGLFILVAIFRGQELHEFMSSATGKVKSLIWSDNLQRPRPEV